MYSQECCCLCKEKGVLFILSYKSKSKNKKISKLYHHKKCLKKILELIHIILKDQPNIKINMDDIITEKHITTDLKKIENDPQQENFNKFAEIYDLEKLIKLIQIDEPVYHILYVLSTWI